VGGVTLQEMVVTNPGEKLVEGGEVQMASKPQPAPTNLQAGTGPTTRVAQADIDPPSGGGTR
jgi:hypothetical protein